MRCPFMNARILALLALLPLTIVAADLPDLVLPAGVGVNIHFTRGHEKDLDLIAAAGFKFIRMDFSWGGTERRKGEFNWADYDELTTNLEKRGLRAYYILDYSNGLYEDTIVSRNPVSGKEQRDTASPSKPESFGAFARWAAAAAAHFKGRRIIWEVWNEPNIGFWKPNPNVTNYTALVLATCQAVRAVDPQATILAPGSSEFPWEFIEHLFQAGALEHIDGISVHPYRSYSKGPETARADYRRLRGMIERHASPARRNLPIISGEWGYATHAKGGVTVDTQAAFIARQQLANLHSGVPLSIWYDWKNDGPDVNYGEHNFGTVTLDLQPKPSFLAVQTLTRQLGGHRIARRLDGSSTNAWVLLCTNERGDQRLAAWTTDTAAEFAFTAKNLSADDVSVVDVTGNAIPPQVEGGQLRLALRPGPQYVTFKKPLPQLTAAAAWRAGPNVPTLITAGKNDSVVVPVSAKNPFEQRALVRFRLGGLPGVVPQEAEKFVPPGQSAGHIFHATVHERPADGFTGAVVTEFLLEDKNERFVTLGRWTEPLDFVIANPLGLSCAPVAAGLRVQIGNPAGEEFEGRLRAGTTDQAIALTRAEPEAVFNLTGESSAARIELRDVANHLVASTPGATFRPLEIPHMKAALDGDAKVPAKANLTWTNAPGENAPHPRAWQLNYQFDSGWRFLRCEPIEAATGRGEKLPIKGRPSALGMWIHGDGSKNALRLRVMDSGGQTFQPTGPNLTWQGWRWVTFDLTDFQHAGHWGGANDGVAHGDLRLDCPLLLDGSRSETKGTIYFAGMTWIYP